MQRSNQHTDPSVQDTSRPSKRWTCRATSSRRSIAARHVQCSCVRRHIRFHGNRIPSKSIERRSIRGRHQISRVNSFSPEFGKLTKIYLCPHRSVALLLQVALPVAQFCDNPVELELKGGTNCEMAPQIDFITEIFRPNLERFNATFDFDLFKRGYVWKTLCTNDRKSNTITLCIIYAHRYFPKGGGHCSISVRPVRHFAAIELLDFGTVTECFGWSYVAGGLPLSLAEQFASAARKSLLQEPAIKRAAEAINIEVYEEGRDMAAMGQKCAGLILGCKTSTGCIVGGSALNSRQLSAQATGEKAANEIVSMVAKRACVDEHVQDQLIVFMALAKGTSKVRMSLPLTLHSRTAIYVVELITKVSFAIHDDANEQTCVVECCGIGLENKYASLG